MIELGFDSRGLNIKRVFESDDWSIDINPANKDKLLQMSSILNTNVAWTEGINLTLKILNNSQAIVLKGDTLNMDQEDLDSLKFKIETFLSEKKIYASVKLDYKQLDGMWGPFANIFVTTTNNQAREIIKGKAAFILKNRRIFVKKDVQTTLKNSSHKIQPIPAPSQTLPTPQQLQRDIIRIVDERISIATSPIEKSIDNLEKAVDTLQEQRAESDKKLDLILSKLDAMHHENPKKKQRT
ncbi:hypothetical protein AKO1_015159 [Acrasis kona]|uniref:Uncharacterized protein n=1 Tax=Acrasis kona TaxID=1008807 RepID=A0AAW2YI13_9EUKA